MLVECLETRLNQNSGSSVKAKEWTTCWRGSVGKVWGEKQNGYLQIFEGLHEIEEREDYSVTLKGKPGTRPGSCRAADT